MLLPASRESFGRPTLRRVLGPGVRFQPEYCSEVSLLIESACLPSRDAVRILSETRFCFLLSLVSLEREKRVASPPFLSLYEPCKVDEEEWIARETEPEDRTVAVRVLSSSARYEDAEGLIVKAGWMSSTLTEANSG